MHGKGGDIFSENQRKGGNLKISVRDRGYETNSMGKHEVHQVVGVQAPGRFFRTEGRVDMNYIYL